MDYSQPRTSPSRGLSTQSVISGRAPQAWRFVTWRVSLASFVIPVILLVATVIWRFGAETAAVELVVRDRATGLPLAGARIVDEGRTLIADAAGQVFLSRFESPRTVTIEHDDYAPTSLVIAPDQATLVEAALRPNRLVGRVIDARTKAPVAGALVSVRDATGSERLTAETDATGSFALREVPESATIHIESPDYGRWEQPIGDQTAINLELPWAVVTGVVVDKNGVPVAGARVGPPDGSTTTVTRDDGSFRLTNAAAAGEVLIRASGFGDRRVAISEDRRAAATLEPERINAVYASQGTLINRARYQTLLDIADTTEINAIVIDVKQDTIYYDTGIPFFREIPGMVTPIFDPAELLAELHTHQIYAIARMVVFKDPVVAEGRPDLGVRDEITGNLWRDDNGAAWVNAFYEELWQANADLAVELAQLGFDEIQYDYIRFPSDGDLRTADFGREYTEETRRAAITGAVQLGAERVRAEGVKFAIDLFAIVAIFGNDQGIGQTVQDLTPLVDYVCLMIYPSHYEEGNIPVDGHPNDFPAETVAFTLESAEALVPGSSAKMRPWLQDFDYPAAGFTEYGPAEVRAQIDAAEALGVSGWMLWNAAGQFQIDALRSDP